MLCSKSLMLEISDCFVKYVAIEPMEIHIMLSIKRLKTSPCLMVSAAQQITQ